MALKLMYRARYLALVVYGEGHPDMATFDVSNAITFVISLPRTFSLKLASNCVLLCVSYILMAEEQRPQRRCLEDLFPKLPIVCKGGTMQE